MLLRPALLVLAFAASGLAWGQALDLTPRFARLSYVEGQVNFQGADQPSRSTLPDRPLEPGDRLATGHDGRAELSFGTAETRLDQDTELTLVHLTATAVRMQLSRGAASLHLRELLDNETFEIGTPNATLTFRRPGEYRVDVSADGATEFTVRTGTADVATAGGPVRVADGQRVRLEGRDPVASLAATQPTDAFDDWVLERELQLAQAEPPAREEADGYYEDESLDRYGEWSDEPGYGRVWMPSYAYGGYDPFRYGRWERVGFGWSWYDPMPWGAYTYHRGRWTYLDHRNRWCWVPERRHPRRHVAQETHPYRQPARDDGRDSDRRDRPRDANPRRNDADERPEVARSPSLPLRIDADRKPTFQRGAETGKPTTRAKGTFARPQEP